MTPTRAIATLGGIGRLPMAPGTWASLAALPLAALIHGALSFPGLLAATLGVLVVGGWAVAQDLRTRDEADPAEIVIDELAGQWIALFPLSGGLWWMGADPAIFPWPGWVAGFALFRFFDIVKPPPVRWADRVPGALGVMLDDVAAGIMAGAVVMLAAAVAHGWLG